MDPHDRHAFRCTRKAYSRLYCSQNFMKNNVYSLREDTRLEKIRNKTRADKKKRARSKAKAKASTTLSTASTPSTES